MAAILGAPLQDVRGGRKDRSRRVLASVLTPRSGPRPGPACVRRPGEAIARFHQGGGGGGGGAGEPLSLPPLSHPCNKAPLLLLPSVHPLHIRSSDWPIKSRKDVSVDERSAQAAKARCGATSSSSSHRTADISPSPATTSKARAPVSGCTPHAFLTWIERPKNKAPAFSCDRGGRVTHRPRC